MLEHALLPVVAVACTGIGYVAGALLASANTAFIIRDKEDAQEAHSLLADKHNILRGHVGDVIELIDSLPKRHGKEKAIRDMLRGDA